MFVEKSHRQGAATTMNRPRRLEPDPFGHGSTAAIARTRIARRFYCDVLRGHEAWDAERSVNGTVSFIVEGTRIDVTQNRSADIEPVVLCVSDPHALAERCWDAGFSVRVGQDASGLPALSVIDPFGRRVELVR